MLPDVLKVKACSDEPLFVRVPCETKATEYVNVTLMSVWVKPAAAFDCYWLNTPKLMLLKGVKLGPKLTVSVQVPGPTTFPGVHGVAALAAPAVNRTAIPKTVANNLDFMIEGIAG